MQLALQNNSIALRQIKLDKRLSPGRQAVFANRVMEEIQKFLEWNENVFNPDEMQVLQRDTFNKCRNFLFDVLQIAVEDPTDIDTGLLLQLLD